MIEKLKRKDIQKAAKVYNKGLQMEIPPGFSTLDETLKKLETRHVFVYKDDGKINGLISFTLKSNDKIKIDFICAMKPRKGIGKKLMNKLVDFSIKNKIELIFTSASSIDKRALNFYESCGFEKFGKYRSYQNLVLYRIKTTPKLIKEHLNKK